MKTIFCPSCSLEVKVPNPLPPKGRGKCPNCGTLVQLPPKLDSKHIAAWVSLLLAFIVFAATVDYHEQYGVQVLGPYVSIILVMTSVGIWLSFRFPRGSWIAASLVGVVWIYSYGRNDYYIEIWQNKDYPTIVYRDEYWRWGNRNSRRLMITYDTVEEADNSVELGALLGDWDHVTMSGELTESGKQHGKWTHRYPGETILDIKTIYKWYWYGEEVSEGEFVSRSGRVSRADSSDSVLSPRDITFIDEGPADPRYDYCTLNFYTRSNLPAVTAFFGHEPISTEKITSDSTIATWRFGSLRMGFEFDEDERLRQLGDEATPQPILTPRIQTLADARRVMGRPPDWSRNVPEYDLTMERWYIEDRFSIQFSNGPLRVMVTGTKEACEAANEAEYAQYYRWGTNGTKTAPTAP